MQILGKFDGFHLNRALFGLVSYNDPVGYPPEIERIDTQK